MKIENLKEMMNIINIKKNLDFALDKYLKKVKIIKKNKKHYVISFYKNELKELGEDITQAYFDELESLKWGLKEVKDSKVSINFPSEFEIIFPEEQMLDQKKLEKKKIKEKLSLSFYHIDVYVEEDDRQIKLDIDIDSFEKNILDQMGEIIYDTYIGSEFDNIDYELKAKTFEAVIKLYSLYKEK